MISVALHSCDGQVREELRLALGPPEDVHITAEVDDLLSLPGTVRDRRPDVVVLHLRASGLAGMEMLKPLLDRRRNPSPTVLVTNSADEGYLARLMQMGLMGCVLRDMAHQELAAAVRAVHAGRRFLCRALCDAFAQKYIDTLNGESDGSMGDAGGA